MFGKLAITFGVLATSAVAVAGLTNDPVETFLVGPRPITILLSLAAIALTAAAIICVLLEVWL